MSTAETLKKKYGPNYFRELRAKVKKPGFSSMDKDRVKAISAKGVAARQANARAKAATEASQEA